MAIAIIGILTTVSIEMSQVIVNNAVEIAGDTIEFNVDVLSEQMISLRKMNLKMLASFKNVMIQIQDFDRCDSNEFYFFFFKEYIVTFLFSI